MIAVTSQPRPKPGVLIAETPSGAILMDVGADRFVSVSRLSASIWRAAADGLAADALVDCIAETEAISTARARLVLQRQFDHWTRADLIQRDDPLVRLPQSRPAPAVGPHDLSHERIGAARLRLRLAAMLFAAERRCRRAMNVNGLAKTLLLLQGERGEPRTGAEATVLATARAYFALRRAFQQGSSAHDCLPRSLALASVLRKQGVIADVCIGVIDQPFCAHAWVEACNLVVNETLDERRKYSVIGRF
jgi:hypothetical protein